MYSGRKDNFNYKKLTDDLQDINNEIRKFEAMGQKARKRMEEQRRKGDTRGADLSAKAYNYCTKYLTNLKHIADGYVRKMNGRTYFTKDARDRYHDKLQKPTLTEKGDL